CIFFFFFQAEDGIRDYKVTGVQTCALPIFLFKGSAWNVKFKLADGLKVLARARVSSYVKRGDVQLVVSALQPRDKGGLQLAFERSEERRVGKEGRSRWWRYH